MDLPRDVPTLTDGDVTLRGHRAEDAEAVVEQCTDPLSVRWTTVPLGYDRAMAETWVGEQIPSAWASGRSAVFALECTHHDGRRRFGGSVELRDEGDGRVELAFGAHPGARGTGATATAVRMLLDWGFGTLGVQTVVWWAEVGNVGSRRIAERCGFTFGGTVPRYLPHRGRMVDAWVATLHRDDPRVEAEPRRAPVLRSGTVVLRPDRLDDVRPVVEACSDPRTRHWLPFLPAPYDEDAARDFLLARVAGTGGDQVSWAVTDATTGAYLAHVGLPRTAPGAAEIGYWAHPDARGRGVVTEAVRLVADHAFAAVEDGGMGLRRLWIEAAEGNTASQQVARANGFVDVGRKRDASPLGDGTVVDLLVLDLLAAEHLGRSR